MRIKISIYEPAFDDHDTITFPLPEGFHPEGITTRDAKTILEGWVEANSIVTAPRVTGWVVEDLNGKVLAKS